MVRKVVLLVDDDPVFVDAISAVLESRYEVATASSGEEALARVEELRPDVIVLDVMMEHLSAGFDAAREIRRRETTNRTPIIMLTGVDEVYNVRMEAGESWFPHDRYLVKPVPPEVLLATVDELVG